jgi:hypothetical protein
MKNLKQYISEKLVLTKKQNYCTLFPETKEELIKMIDAEISKNGNECNLNHIDVSKITDMSHLFSSHSMSGCGLGDFNGDISEWNVSKVTNMRGMFYGAYLFNQSIENWDVSSVKDMTRMFAGAKSFNQPIGDWDVSGAESMTSMFENTSSFNQPIENWDVSNVKDIEFMFCFAKSFNQDISNWKINVKCDSMFLNCKIKEEYKPKGSK